MKIGWICLLLMLLCRSAPASSCLGPITICSSYQASQIVFRGLAMESAQDPSPRFTAADGSVSYSGPTSSHIRFRVLEVFRGTPGAEIVVTSGGWSSPYIVGKEYLVFATTFATRPEPIANVCSRGHPLEDPADDPDLAWLRAYPTAPPVASIFGTVQPKGYHAGRSAHFDATITLSGGTEKTAVLDGKNSYRFDGLQPGSYTVTASLPAGMVGDAPKKVAVEAKGCAEIDWYISSDSHIRGTVRDASGAPAAGVPVRLLQPSTNSRFGYTLVQRTATGPDGRWEFTRIDPGDYLIALHDGTPTDRDPYAAVFYPSSSTPSGAQPIHLDPAGAVDGLEMIAPERLTQIVVQARALHADGSPAPNAHFTASDTLRTTAEVLAATGESDGSAELHLYAGREYDLIANEGTNDLNANHTCAGPVRFVARTGMVLADLKFDKSFHECRSPSAARTLEPAPIR